ncbi:MAG: hypothetical protein AAGA30_18745, partial [Planctomycetota bacterium]
MSKYRNQITATVVCCIALSIAAIANSQTSATPGGDSAAAKAAVAKLAAAKPKSDFPSLESVTKGYTEVKSSDGKKPYIKLWTSDKKDGQMLAELPR